MLNYAYYCGNCENEWENFHTIEDRQNEWCGKCGYQAHIDMSKYTRAIHVFKPFISQEMSETDVTITSKRQYKEELKKRGLSCRAF